MGTKVADILAKYTSQVQLEEYAKNNGFAAHLAEYAIHLTHYTKTVGVLVESTNGLDDTIRIQTAIKYCFDNNIAYLSFEPNKTYLLDNATTDCSIIFYGKNLTVLGNNATLKKINPVLGEHGDVMDIYGLVNGTRYPLIGLYTGENTTAENILIENLNVEATDDVPTGCNNIGIVNVENVILRNVKSINAPSGGFVVVTENELLPNDNVVFENCHAIDCRELSYRLTKTFADTGLGKNNLVMRNCTGTNVKGVYPYGESGSTGKKLHLYYRQKQDVANPNLYLKIENCKFDETAQFVVTSGCANLTVKGTTIQGGLFMASGQSDLLNSNVVFDNTKISCNLLKEGALTESPLLMRYIKGVKFQNCIFSDVLNDGLPLGTHTIRIENCDDITFDNVKNLNIYFTSIIAPNKNITLLNSLIKHNNLQLEASSHYVLRASSIDGLKIYKCNIQNALMEFKAVNNMHFDHNDCLIDKNTGSGFIDKDVNCKNFVVTNNTIKIGANSTNTMNIMAIGDSFIEDNNLVISNDGNYRSKVMYGTAIPTVGYRIKGDRVINSAPAVGQPKSWVCITTGTPGTWVSEGNL